MVHGSTGERPPGDEICPGISGLSEPRCGKTFLCVVTDKRFRLGFLMGWCVNLIAVSIIFDG